MRSIILGFLHFIILFTFYMIPMHKILEISMKEVYCFILIQRQILVTL